MEELWLEEGRSTLYQGLLQAAVGLHHWRNDNFSGAVKLFSQAEAKLAAYPNETSGLDLLRLRADMARSLSLLRGPAAEERTVAGTIPAAFQSFDLIVTDERLRALSGALAEVPYEQRVHAAD